MWRPKVNLQMILLYATEGAGYGARSQTVSQDPRRCGPRRFAAPGPEAAPRRHGTALRVAKLNCCMRAYRRHGQSERRTKYGPLSRYYRCKPVANVTPALVRCAIKFGPHRCLASATWAR